MTASLFNSQSMTDIIWYRTLKLTGFHGAQQSEIPVQRLVM